MNNLGFHCQQLHHLRDRVVANDLTRGEFYNFPREELPELRRAISACGVAASIHCPLERLDWYPDPPTWTFLCDRERERRQLTLRMIEATLASAADIEAEYVVAHFPCPSTDAPPATYEELRPIALDSCYQIAKLSERYGVPVHLEGFGPSPFLNEDFLAEVFTQFTNLRYCFDSGHMGLAARRDGIDLYLFAERIRPYLGSIHLWNTRGMEDYIAYRHIPVHPSQRPEEGWVDIARLIGILRQGNPGVPIIFESIFAYPRALGNYDIRDGIAWIRELATSY